MRRRHYGQSSSMAEMERLSMKTVYKGETMTVAEARARKSADTRRKNLQKKEEDGRNLILPEVRKQITATRKSTRCLKSILAFLDNGPIQWPGDFKLFKKYYPELMGAFVRYKAQYQKIMKLEEELDKVLRRSKTSKSFFGIAQDFGYQMLNLLDIVEEISSKISKSDILIRPYLSTREIVVGAKDGRRPGLKHIISHTFENMKKTKQNLINLARSINDAYQDVVVYNNNGHLI